MATEITVADLVAYLRLKDTASPAIKAAAKGMVDAANGVGDAWSNSAQRAAQKMERMHEEAIRMNASLLGTDDRAQQLSATFGALTSTASTTASAFGLQVPALGAINQAAQVASLGLGNLSKTMVGFTAASAGVIGAGLAIGWALGTLARQFSYVSTTFDDGMMQIARYAGMLDNLPPKLGAAEQAALNLAVANQKLAGSQNVKAEQERMQAEIAATDMSLALEAKRAEIKELAAKKAEEYAAAEEKRMAAEFRWLEELIARDKKVAEERGANLKKVVEAAKDANEFVAQDQAETLQKMQADLLAFAEAGIQQMRDLANVAAANEARLANAERARLDDRAQLASNLRDLTDLMDALGVSSDNTFSKMIAGFAAGLEATNALQAATAALNSGSFFGGAATGAAYGSTFGLPGMLIGGLVGGVLGLFGGKSKAAKEAEEARKQMEELYQSFLQSAGGLDALRAKADEAGVSLDALFDAKKPEEMRRAIDDVKAGLDLWAEATEKTNAAMERYGITIDQMGEKFAQQELDKQAGQLIQDYMLLTGAGADVALVNEKMAGAINEYLQIAMKAGTTVPNAMKPIMESLLKQGLLTDEAGTKLETLDGITFGESTSAMDQLVLSVQALVDALRQAFGLSGQLNTSLGNTPIPPPYNPHNPDNEEEHHFAGGGYIPANPPHGSHFIGGEKEGEYIIPESQIGRVRGGPAGGGMNVTMAPQLHFTGADITDAQMDRMLDRLYRNERGELERLRLHIQGRVGY